MSYCKNKFAIAFYFWFNIKKIKTLEGNMLEEKLLKKIKTINENFINLGFDLEKI